MNTTETILALLESVERKGVTELIEWLTHSDYFTAPASTVYHLNREGGLAQHSLNVYYTLQNLNEVYGLNLKEDTMIFTALLHDVCKVNLYKPNILKSGQQSTAKPYEHDDQLPLGHAEKSLAILNKIIELTEQEQMMIRWHMGTFDKAFFTYQKTILDKFPECLAMFMADWTASVYVDTKKEEE